MRGLFFSSTVDDTDSKWSVTFYVLSLLAVVTEILHPFGFSFRSVLILDEPIVLLISPVVLAFAVTNLLILPARVSRNALSRIPKTVLIIVSLVFVVAQLAYLQNHWLVLILSFVVYFILGHDEDFKNPHIVTNIIVSGIRAIESVVCLVMSCILILDLVK